MAFDRITVEPGKMDGQPCVRGYRFTVAHLVRLVADGWTFDRIRQEFDFIEPDDVSQALQYAAASSEVTMLPLQESA